MTDTPNSHDDVIVYPKGDDAVEDMADHVNYSTALKNRRMGEALCKSNPAAKRKLDKKLLDINKQQRRRKADLYQRQREFFSEQLFAKGLNPFIKKIDSGDAAEPEVDYRLSRGSSRGSSRGKHKVTFLDDDHDDTFSLSRSGPLSNNLYRSHTIGDIPTSANRPSTNLTSLNYEHGSKREQSWLIAPRRYQDEYDLPRIPGPTVQHMPIHERKPQLSPIREAIEAVQIPAPPSNKHLPDLKQHPEMLFPKMKVLLNNDVTSDDAAKPVSANRGKVTPHRITLPQVLPAPGSPDENGQFGPKHVMRMIHNLSTSLPQHLRSAASAQIREMAHTDRIDEHKARLKQENVPWLRRERSLEDKRWFKLENSLSPRVSDGGGGDNMIWRRMSGSWQQCRKYQHT